MRYEESRKLLQPFLDKVYRRSKSKETIDTYLSGVVVFCRFCGKEPMQVIKDVKGDKTDVYKVLDDYVTYLSKSNRAPNTIATYFAAAKKFLRVYGVELSSDKLKETIDKPRIHAITEDRIPTIEEMKAILYSANKRGKALISMLASSGMRIGELLSLRVKDIDFTAHPTLMRLRAEVTKDRQGRVCFISDEATELLKEYIEKRVNDESSYIFQRRDHRMRGENRPIAYSDTKAIFNIAVKKAGIHEKDDHGRNKIHLHVLRKFFFTQLVPVLGREITEALMGHRSFLDSAYRRFTESQLGEYYLKGMHTVTILDSKHAMQPIDVRLESVKEYMRQEGLNPDDFIIKKRIEFAREITPEEQIDLISKELTKLKNRHEDKVITPDELELYIDDGWSYVDELNNGKVIVRKSNP